MREREIKLLVEAGRQLPPVTELLRGIGDGSVEQVDQNAVYFDTADLRLTRGREPAVPIGRRLDGEASRRGRWRDVHARRIRLRGHARFAAAGRGRARPRVGVRRPAGGGRSAPHAPTPHPRA